MGTGIDSGAAKGNIMRRDDLLAIFAFDAAANRAVLDTAAQLTDEALAREFSPSHGSIRQLLVHIVGGDMYFAALCRDETPDMTGIEALTTLDAIRAQFEQAARDLQATIEGLSDDALQQDMTVRFGEHTFSLPRWQVLLQVFTHAHMHRGELSILLSQLGHPLPTLDLMVHFVKASGQQWPFD